MTDHPLKRYRDKSGLTQSQLAIRLGTTKGTISRWEASRRVPRDLLEIAAKTGISPTEFLEFEARNKRCEAAE